ncbi:MAG: MotA/TolQ/ExbB proton channel family protein [Pseudomonadota bacterium]
MPFQTQLASLLGPVQQLADIGGPVLLILLVVSIGTLTLVVFKAMQYGAARVGSRRDIDEGVKLVEAGDRAAALATFERSRHFLAPAFALGVKLGGRPGSTPRMEAEAERLLVPLEKGFRVMDTVAQLAPLLGLLGTVLGMIEAFQALQAAGSQVDPTALAGGIWVALLTTAAGLAVAMPTSIALSWFESRIEAERLSAEYVFSVIGTPLKGESGGA